MFAGIERYSWHPRTFLWYETFYCQFNSVICLSGFSFALWFSLGRYVFLQVHPLLLGDLASQHLGLFLLWSLFALKARCTAVSPSANPGFSSFRRSNSLTDDISLALWESCFRCRHLLLQTSLLQRFLLHPTRSGAFYFLIVSLAAQEHGQFSLRLNFQKFLLYLILVLNNTWYNFHLLKFFKSRFVAQYLICSVEHAVCIWKEFILAVGWFNPYMSVRYICSKV